MKTLMIKTNTKIYFFCLFNLRYTTQPRLRVIIIPHSPVVRLALVQCGSPYCLHHTPLLIASWLRYIMV